MSSDDRESLLRAARTSSVKVNKEGTKIPVRTSKKRRSTPQKTNAGGGRTIKPPTRNNGRGKEKPKRGRNTKRTLLRNTGIVLLFIILITGGLFSAKILTVGKNILNPDRSIVAQITDLLFRRNRSLLGEEHGQVNILLVGVGGEGHDGEDLADAIMIAMVRPEDKQVAFLSIPRDLYVQIPDSQNWQRINAIHAIGEQRDERHGGVKLLRQKVEEIAGIDIHYYGRVDFTAYKHIIDEVGGVEVTIEDSFFDYLHEISFPAGTERMSGERALAYIRARYVEGPQGGDFKRAERQQDVLIALRDKVFSPSTAFDLRKASGILDALSGNVVTNFTLSELKYLGDIIREIPHEEMRTSVLTTGPDGLLIGKPQILGGRPAATLQPRAGIDDYGEIQQFIQELFDTHVTAEAPTPTATPTPAPTPTPSSIEDEEPSVEVRNGTLIQGLASRAASSFRDNDFTVTAIGNASRQDRERTILVDLTDGEKTTSRDALIAILKDTQVVQFPETEASSTADFLIILGSDAEDHFSR